MVIEKHQGLRILIRNLCVSKFEYWNYFYFEKRWSKLVSIQCFCHLIAYLDLQLLNLPNVYDISKIKTYDLAVLRNTIKWNHFQHEITSAEKFTLWTFRRWQILSANPEGWWKVSSKSFKISIRCKKHNLFWFFRLIHLFPVKRDVSGDYFSPSSGSSLIWSIIINTMIP